MVIDGGYKDLPKLKRRRNHQDERRAKVREDLKLNGRGTRRMTPDEVDRCAGLYFHTTENGRIDDGDYTNAPEATIGDRLAAIGNSIMIQTYLFLFSYLPELNRGRPDLAPPSSSPPTSPGSRAGPGVHERAGAGRRGVSKAPRLTAEGSSPPVPFPFDPELLRDLELIDTDQQEDEEDSRSEASEMDLTSRAVDGIPPEEIC